MSAIGFHIVKLWVAFLSIHPYWLLYLKSDCYFFLVYHLLRYRRKVVRLNLLNSFPDKSEKEIKHIERRFYQNLCDLFVEAPKMLRMKKNGYRNRIHYTNLELVKQLYEQGKNVFYAIPHSGPDSTLPCPGAGSPGPASALPCPQQPRRLPRGPSLPATLLPLLRREELWQGGARLGRGPASCCGSQALGSLPSSQCADEIRLQVHFLSATNPFIF